MYAEYARHKLNLNYYAPRYEKIEYDLTKYLGVAPTYDYNKKLPMDSNQPKISSRALSNNRPTNSNHEPMNMPVLPKNSDEILIHTKRSGTIDSYKLGKILGGGNYAKVRDASLIYDNDFKYAVKIYNKQSRIEPERIVNIQKEITALKKMNHPSIVKLVESIEDAWCIYLVFENLKGGSFNSYVRSSPGGRLNESEGRRLFTQIVEAVRHIHYKGIAHRDLKMDNLLLDENGNVKLIDFGFAITLKPGIKLHTWCGTPNYMAPEILKRGGYDGMAVDIWSLLNVKIQKYILFISLLY